MIANECGVTTVGDFRLSDIAVGGQGAPLVPYMDRILLRGHYEETGRLGLLLNIGGISNVSAYIPQGEVITGLVCLLTYLKVKSLLV